MPSDQPIPPLIRFIFSNQAENVAATAGERLLRWSAAFDEWLEERRVLLNEDMCSKARRAWRDFSQFHGRVPWEIAEKDVLGWVDALNARGYTPSTVNQRVHAISGFYQYCYEHQVDLPWRPAGPDGASPPPYNPALWISRQKCPRYAPSYYLSLAELHAFLNAIESIGSPVSKRDYAIFLALLKTGLEPEILRAIRWGDLQLAGGAACLSVQQGEQVRRLALPVDVWAAILAYLQASGRLASIQPTDYLFAPLADPMLHSLGNEASAWNQARFISKTHLKHLAKCFARAAGLDASLVTCSVIQNTGVFLRVQAGDDVAEIQEYLGRSSAHKVRLYLDSLSPYPCSLFVQAGLACPSSDRPSPLLSSSSEVLSPGLNLSPAGEPGQLELEIQKLKALMEYVFSFVEKAATPSESMHYVEMYTRIAARLGNLIRVQQTVGPGRSEHDKAVDLIMQEFIRDHGLDKPPSDLSLQSENQLDQDE